MTMRKQYGRPTAGAVSAEPWAGGGGGRTRLGLSLRRQSVMVLGSGEVAALDDEHAARSPAGRCAPPVVIRVGIGWRGPLEGTVRPRALSAAACRQPTCVSTWWTAARSARRRKGFVLPPGQDRTTNDYKDAWFGASADTLAGVGGLQPRRSPSGYATAWWCPSGRFHARRHSASGQWLSAHTVCGQVCLRSG
jgi:hypothetical protein